MIVPLGVQKIKELLVKNEQLFLRQDKSSNCILQVLRPVGF